MPKNMKKDGEKVPEIQLVIFRLRDEEFGVPISEVREIVRMMPITHIPETPGFIKGLINLRGKVIPVVDLAEQFELAPEDKLPKTARIMIVENKNDCLLGLIVDEVPEVIKIPEISVESTPEIIETEVHEDYLKGVAKLENRLIILLDLENVLNPHEVEAAKKCVGKPAD